MINNTSLKTNAAAAETSTSGVTFHIRNGHLTNGEQVTSTLGTVQPMTD